MKKIILGFVALAVLLFAGVNMFGAVAAGHILENAIDAPVSVGRLHVGIFTSSVGLYNAEIKNPKGFSEKKLADIHEISVKIDAGGTTRWNDGRNNTRRLPASFS